MAKSQNDDPRRKDHGIQSSEGLAPTTCAAPTRNEERHSLTRQKSFNSKNLSYYELSYLNFHLIFYLSLFKSLWVGHETFSVWNFWCLNSLNLSFLQGPPLVLPVLPKD